MRSAAACDSPGTVTNSGCGVHVDQVQCNVAPEIHCTCH